MIEHWETIKQIVGFVIAPAITWFASRKFKELEYKKKQTENDIAEVDNKSRVVELYKEALDDLDARFKGKISELEAELERIKALNEELRQAISDQEDYIHQLKTKIRNYEELEG